MNRANATMEQLKKSEQSLRDAEAALKAKRESNGLESEIQALREQLQKHEERQAKLWEEIGEGQTRVAEFADELSAAKVNAEFNFKARDRAISEMQLWDKVSLACTIIGTLMMLGGFYFWYAEVQVHQDAILRKQAAEIEKRTGEPTMPSES